MIPKMTRGMEKCSLILEKLKLFKFKHLLLLSKKTFTTELRVNRTFNINKNQIIKNKNKPWRVLFFGTDAFALESLRKLENEYRLDSLLSRLEVVTSYKGAENEVIKFSKDKNLKIYQWPIDEPIIDFDIGVVVSFGHLIPSVIIQSFPLGIINVHASLLPRWRGAAPIIYALLNGDTRTGITIMKVEAKKFDIGEIIAQEAVDIRPDEMHSELYRRLSIIGSVLLIEIMKKLPNILDEGIPQPTDGITRAPKITCDISIVKWSKMSAKNVYDLHRAVSEIHPLTTIFQGQILKLHGIKMIDSNFQVLSTTETALSITPGLMLYIKQLNLLGVQCADGNWISIDQVTLTKYKKMNTKDFNNGFIKKKLNKVILET